MYLVRLVYTSTISEGFGSKDVEGILDSARKNNKKNNVTGLLCFSHNIFLQCLEGSRTKVNSTYHAILNDARHEKVIMLDYKEIVEREFDSWSMGYVPTSSLTEPANIKYSGTPDFNPYEMSGESALRLLCKLRDTLPIQG